MEITRDHVSWFVDTKVMRTERRTEALAAVKYRPQFVIAGDSAARMNESWMQMDWVRYYSLKRPNAKSIDAKQMWKRTYDGAC